MRPTMTTSPLSVLLTIQFNITELSKLKLIVISSRRN